MLSCLQALPKFISITRKLRKLEEGEAEKEMGEQVLVSIWVLSAGPQQGRGGAREEQALPVLCSAELSLCFILLCAVAPSGSQFISRLGRHGGCSRLHTDPLTRQPSCSL